MKLRRESIEYALFFILGIVLFKAPVQAQKNNFYYGADLSYLNEMLDCGATYKDTSGKVTDPYQIFKDAGANLIRLRLWHNPDWTNYSTFEDVKKSIRKAKKLNQKILLDFHYSDNWADPEKQEIPAAWLPHINNTEVLGDSLYNYTYTTLLKLHKENLLPEMVQIGNETNAMILQEAGKELKWPIDWERNAHLLNRGIEAVRDMSKISGKNIEVMLHIAQPENALWWFEQAHQNGIAKYEWIGLSYYPLWSKYKFDALPVAIDSLVSTYGKRLMVVETAYPFTLENNDEASNILSETALIDGFPMSEKGQLDYLNALKEKIAAGGGEGLIYWEPAWISTGCSTRWGKGSHWDNATLFNFQSQPTMGMQFYNAGR